MDQENRGKDRGRGRGWSWSHGFNDMLPLEYEFLSSFLSPASTEIAFNKLLINFNFVISMRANMLERERDIYMDGERHI